MIGEEDLNTFLSEEYFHYQSRNLQQEPIEVFLAGVESGLRLAEKGLLKAVPEMADNLIGTVLQALKREPAP